MRAFAPPLRSFVLGVLGFLTLAAARPARGDCPFCIDGFSSPGSSGPNVRWTSSDSLSACPAGDTLLVNDPLHLHPARLRIGVEYFDSDCSPRPGIPPDSIWVTWATSSGNVAVNDQSSQVFADDSTDGCGFARVTFPSLSGCGVLSVYLYVSGVFQGSKAVLVRTIDGDANGRGDGFDPACDLDYDGVLGLPDVLLRNAHNDHWHRNALHGTLVRRTNYCETCPPISSGTRGGSEVFWSPSGRFLSHTQFISQGGLTRCKVFIVPSDPKDGDALTQFSFEPYADHDYQPSWSPRNDFIAWDRRDKSIIRKRVPWSGDATEVVITTSDNFGCGTRAGDAQPTISPNGEWVAFTRCNPRDPVGPGGWSLWKVPINGGTAIQLTPTAARTDFFPSWSPDGQTIYFQRQDGLTVGDERWVLWKVPAAGGPAQQVYLPPGSPLTDAVQPALSPDARILLMGHGVRDDVARNVIMHTLDPTIPSPSVEKLIPNYPDTNFAANGPDPLLSPRLSPDGTRTGLGSKQVWAARRNMNRPPAFVSVTSTGEGTRAVADTAATMDFTFSCSFGAVNMITLSASDPEGDPLTYLADFLITGMSWDPMTRTLTYLAAGACPQGTFYVRFRVTTQSGGTDALIAAITFPFSPLGAGNAGPSAMREEPEGATVAPTLDPFAVAAPSGSGPQASLVVFDLAGRRIATVRGAAGEPLIWERRDDSGHPVATGIYLYRLQAGTFRREGKFVVVR